jgi:hypothetical protein
LGHGHDDLSSSRWLDARPSPCLFVDRTPGGGPFAGMTNEVTPRGQESAFFCRSRPIPVLLGLRASYTWCRYIFPPSPAALASFGPPPAVNPAADPPCVARAGSTDEGDD